MASTILPWLNLIWHDMIAVKLIQNIKKGICKAKKMKQSFVSGMLPSFSKSWRDCSGLFNSMLDKLQSRIVLDRYLVPYPLPQLNLKEYMKIWSYTVASQGIVMVFTELLHWNVVSSGFFSPVSHHSYLSNDISATLQQTLNTGQCPLLF